LRVVFPLLLLVVKVTKILDPHGVVMDLSVTLQIPSQLVSQSALDLSKRTAEFIS
jgi:hypothetical protein